MTVSTILVGVVCCLLATTLALPSQVTTNTENETNEFPERVVPIKKEQVENKPNFDDLRTNEIPNEERPKFETLEVKEFQAVEEIPQKKENVDEIVQEIEDIKDVAPEIPLQKKIIEEQSTLIEQSPLKNEEYESLLTKLSEILKKIQQIKGEETTQVNQKLPEPIEPQDQPILTICQGPNCTNYYANPQIPLQQPVFSICHGSICSPLYAQRQGLGFSVQTHSPITICRGQNCIQYYPSAYDHQQQPALTICNGQDCRHFYLQPYSFSPTPSYHQLPYSPYYNPFSFIKLGYSPY